MCMFNFTCEISYFLPALSGNYRSITLICVVPLTDLGNTFAKDTWKFGTVSSKNRSFVIFDFGTDFMLERRVVYVVVCCQRWCIFIKSQCWYLSQNPIPMCFISMTCVVMPNGIFYLPLILDALNDVKSMHLLYLLTMWHFSRSRVVYVIVMNLYCLYGYPFLQ